MRLLSGQAAKTASGPLGWLLTAVVAVAVGGCSGNPLNSMKLYPVKGKVLLDDGKPVSSSRIVFVGTTSALSFTSPVESDGTFTVKGSTGDGLPAGEYRARLEVDESKLPPVKGAPAKQKGSLPFPDMYGDEDTSQLKATVKPDETANNFEFKLTKSPKGQGGESQGRQR
jgi:hypothetical protein